MSIIYFNSYFIYHRMFMITISIVQENGKSLMRFYYYLTTIKVMVTQGYVYFL
jgi:hypothetical protein